MEIRIKAGEVNPQVEEIKGICRESLYALCTQFLGYPDWDSGDMEKPGVHDDLEKFLRKPARKKALLLPRNHLKSTFVTIALTIQEILKNPNVRILIGNGVWDIARTFLTEIKAQLEGSQLKYLFGDFVSGRWNADEIIVKQRTKALKEPTVMTTGVEAETTGGHFDVILLDDLMGLQNSQTPDQRAKVKRFRRSMINLLEPRGGRLLEVGCLTAGTKVLKADGTWKRIEEFKLGEKIVSHDSIETVEAMIPQGKADVFRLKTRNFTIEATANHPFLTRDGFKKLEDLKVGDKVFVLSSFDVGGNGVSTEDAFAVGFMLGDGWIVRTPNTSGGDRWITCVARKVDEAKNNRMLSYVKNKFGISMKLTNAGYYRTDIKEVGQFFESMGIFGTSKTKRFPDWIFGKETAIKKSFLNGFIAADGTRMKTPAEQYAVEISNSGMLDDFRYLALNTGLKPSNVHQRTRTLQPPNSPYPVVSTSFHASIGTRISDQRWREAGIISIEKVGEKEVFDLTVSNTHNFVANGFVVHNTRWSLDDTFSEIFEKESKYYDVMIRKVVENGKLIFPKKFAQKFDSISKSWTPVDDPTCMDYIDHLKASMPLDEFSAQYENSPMSIETQLFKPEMFKYWNQRPEGIFVGMAVDLAISEARTADETAITVLGMDKDWKLYILDYLNGRWRPSEVVDNILQMKSKWKPDTVGMETNGFQNTLKLACEDAMRVKRDYFPIEEIRTGPERSKENRIKSLEPFYRNGTVYHAAWMKGKDMEVQLQTFPKGKRDDIIDACAMTLPLLQPGIGTYDHREDDWDKAIRQARMNDGRYRGFFDYGF